MFRYQFESVERHCGYDSHGVWHPQRWVARALCKTEYFPIGPRVWGDPIWLDIFLGEHLTLEAAEAACETFLMDQQDYLPYGGRD